MPVYTTHVRLGGPGRFDRGVSAMGVFAAVLLAVGELVAAVVGILLLIAVGLVVIAIAVPLVVIAVLGFVAVRAVRGLISGGRRGGSGDGAGSGDVEAQEGRENVRVIGSNRSGDGE